MPTAQLPVNLGEIFPTPKIPQPNFADHLFDFADRGLNSFFDRQDELLPASGDSPAYLRSPALYNVYRSNRCIHYSTSDGY